MMPRPGMLGGALRVTAVVAAGVALVFVLRDKRVEQQAASGDAPEVATIEATDSPPAAARRETGRCAPVAGTSRSTAPRSMSPNLPI